MNLRETLRTCIEVNIIEERKQMLKNPVIHGALVGLVTISLIGCQAGSSAPSASEKSKNRSQPRRRKVGLELRKHRKNLDLAVIDSGANECEFN